MRKFGADYFIGALSGLGLGLGVAYMLLQKYGHPPDWIDPLLIFGSAGLVWASYLIKGSGEVHSHPRG